MNVVRLQSASLLTCVKAALSLIMLQLVVLLVVYVVPSSAQEPVLPLKVLWNSPTHNEDESCLFGNDAACSRDLARFHIYRGVSNTSLPPNRLELYASASATDSLFIDPNIAIGWYYFYAVTAVDNNGNESAIPASVGMIGLSVVGDTDRDQIPNGLDNCPLVVNPDQLDSNSDSIGDACTERNGEPPPSPQGQLCLSDDDNDSICDEVDNCPTVANLEQLDGDHDGVGDSCDRVIRQVRCSPNSDSTTSAIALYGNTQYFLVDPRHPEAFSTQFVGHSVSVVGDFNAQTRGPQEISLLEVGDAVASIGERLYWKVHAADHVNRFPFAKRSDRVIGCFADEDNQVDLVAVASNKLQIRSSRSGAVIRHTLSGPQPLGQILDAVCGDINGDGRDEIAVLHSTSAKKSKRPPAISIFSLEDGAVVRSLRAAAGATKVVLADTEGSGSAQVCSLAESGANRSTILCPQSSRKKISVPRASDITVGRFEAGVQRESFVTVGKKGTVQVVSATGQVLIKKAERVIATSTPKVPRTLKFLQCR